MHLHPEGTQELQSRFGEVQGLGPKVSKTQNAQAVCLIALTMALNTATLPGFTKHGVKLQAPEAVG